MTLVWKSKKRPLRIVGFQSTMERVGSRVEQPASALKLRPGETKIARPARTCRLTKNRGKRRVCPQKKALPPWDIRGKHEKCRQEEWCGISIASGGSLAGGTGFVNAHVKRAIEADSPKAPPKRPCEAVPRAERSSNRPEASAYAFQPSRAARWMAKASCASTAPSGAPAGPVTSARERIHARSWRPACPPFAIS